MTAPDAVPAAPHSVGAVLGLPGVRSFWAALGLSSLGDWLGLLALTALANELAGAGYADRNFAVAGVLFLRVLPALVIGPLGGYLADHLDRRAVLVVGDVLRAVIFVSIPLVGTLSWLLVATVLVEAVNLVWLPTKDATVPALVPPVRLEAANRLVLATTYGSALPAAVLFTALAVTTEAFASMGDWPIGAAEVALYANGASFAVSALLLLRIRSGLPGGPAVAASERVGVVRAVLDGWAYAVRTRLVRGLVVGIAGAFAAGGVVIGLARVYAAELGAGDPGYGVLFGAVFAGLGGGMWRGPRLLRGVSRRRLFGLAVVGAGLVLLVLSLVSDMVLAALLVLLLGFCAGVAWITGYTLLGLEVDAAVRGRTFALVQSLVRLALALALAAAPLLAGLVGRHRLPIADGVGLTYGGVQVAFGVAAVLAVGVGVASFRSMNDRLGASVAREVWDSLAHTETALAGYAPLGLFVAFEGGEGAGKSTQARLLVDALAGRVAEVVLTHEPGDTAVGRSVRAILLDPVTGTLSPRTEALLYAADKAEHVATVVRPALRRGAAVITDRYVDSTLAYQGGGRALTVGEVEQVARWATEQLRPHLTVFLDLPAAEGLRRAAAGSPDRLEQEPVDFHERVRGQFRTLADADAEHYLVLDAALPAGEVAAAVLARVETQLSRARPADPARDPRVLPPVEPS